MKKTNIFIHFFLRRIFSKIVINLVLRQGYRFHLTWRALPLWILFFSRPTGSRLSNKTRTFIHRGFESEITLYIRSTS